MANSKYRFNPDTLSFDPIERSLRDRVLRVFAYLISSIFIGGGLMLIVSIFIDLPKERMLKRDNEFLLSQYDLLSKKMDVAFKVLGEIENRDDNLFRVIFEAEPIPSAIRKAGFGGTDRYSKLEGYKNSDVIIYTAKKLDKIVSELVVQSKSFDEVFEMAKNKTKMLACIPAIQPVSNKNLKRLSSYYGYRTDPIYKVKKFHEGIDFSAPIGTPIYSTGDGVVKEIKKSRRGYGNRILIDHGYGYQTFYAHIYKFKVHKGQRIERGQVIATVGNTGKSTAPHLHYEVRKDGKAVNPIYYFFNDLTPDEYETVLELSTRPTQSLD